MVQFVCVCMCETPCACMHVCANGAECVRLFLVDSYLACRRQSRKCFSTGALKCDSVYECVKKVCMCMWTATTAPSPMPAGLPMKGLDVWGGKDGVMVEGGGGRTEEVKDSCQLALSNWTRSHQIFTRTFLPLSSCCYLGLCPSTTLCLLTLSQIPALTFISVFSPFAISLSLFSCPPHLISPPILHSNLFLSANILSHLLCARCAGQIQLAPWQPSKPCIAGILWMLSDGSSGRRCVSYVCV